MSKYMDEIGVKYLWDKTKSMVAENVNEIKTEIASVYRYRGTVATLAELKKIQKATLAVGDVYNVKENGMNYAWTGDQSNEAYDEGWDPLGGVFEIPTLSVSDLDSILV